MSYYKNSDVKRAMEAHDAASASDPQIKMLKELLLLGEDDEINPHKRTVIINKGLTSKEDVMVCPLDDGQIGFLSIEDHHKKLKDALDKERGKKAVDASASEEPRHVQLTGEIINSVEDFNSLILKDSFRVSPEQIKDHLKKFISTIPKNGEGYYTGEVKIFYYKALEKNTEKLVGAGTAVLDAILYCSTSEEGKGIFSIKEVSEVTTTSISFNLSKAKAAILAAVVLVYIQGGLPPSVGVDKRPIPKFVQGLVKQWAKNLVDIGRALSCTDTRKFPEVVFLELPLKDLPASVASRCRLNIAGNRAVRYAKFAAPYERAAKRTIVATMTNDQVANVMKHNERVKHATEIVDFLISVDGKESALMKMHPLSPTRPTVKNLTAKLTRAILESLSITGRLQLVNKIDEQAIAAFKADTDFYGSADGQGREWSVLSESEKDFSELTLAVLKGYYGM